MKSIAGSSEKRHMLNRVALVIGGNLLFAVGINMIITPMNLYSSGFTGMSMLLRMLLVDVLHVPQIPGIDYLGIIYYLLNMPLFVLAYKSLGREFCVTTVISIGIASLCMSLVPVASKPVFDDYLTACLVGGLVSGTGAGMVLKGRHVGRRPGYNRCRSFKDTSELQCRKDIHCHQYCYLRSLFLPV